MSKSTGIIGLLVAAGLVWGGATWYMGNQTKKELDESLVATNHFLATSHANTTITEVSYEKNFLSSTAVYKLSIKLPELQEEPLELLFNTHVYHGPFPKLEKGNFTPALAIVESTLVNNDNTKMLFELANGQEPVSSSTQISFSGDINGTIKTAALQYSNAQRGINASIEPGNFVSSTNRDLSFFNINGQFGAIKLSEKDEFTLDIASLFMSSDAKRSAHDNFIGTSTFKTDKISTVLDKKTSISIDAVSIDTSTSETATGLVNADIVYRLDTLKANDINFGNSDLKFIMNNLDMQAINAFSKAVSAINPSSPDADELMVDQFEILFGKILASNPSFEISPLRINTASGQATLNVGAIFNTEDIAPDNKADLESYAIQALRKVNFSTSIDDNFIKEMGAAVIKFENTQGENISEEEIMQMASLAGPIAEQSGMAVYKDGKITSDIVFDASQPEDSQIDFNGKKMGLNEFAMRASSLLGFAGTSAAPALLNEEELFQALENDTEAEPAE